MGTLSWILPVIVFGLTAVATRLSLPLLAKWNLIDVPNPRSSHSRPKPRGGGLALVVFYLLGLGAAAWIWPISPRAMAAFIGGGIMAGGIGLWDDLRSPGQLPRFILQLLVVLWTLYWIGRGVWAGLPLGMVGRMLASAICAVGMLWMINLFNFMDGIDGLAGVEACTSALFAGMLLFGYGEKGASASCFLLAAAAAGFLLWNWPPSRVFLGDTGSLFLGFWIAGHILWTSAELPEMFLPWMILSGVFTVDATITLLVRFLRGEKWYQAHASHAYQHAARRWGHLPVTAAVGLINAFWLFPLAYLALNRPGLAWLFTVIALLPVIAGAVCLKAGRS